MKLLGIGDNVMDAYLFRGELYPGGNAANVSVLARRAGADRSGYLGILATDPAGLHFRAALEEEGIDLARLRQAVGMTACNYIHLDESGDRVFSGNNGQETVQSLFLPVLTQTDRDYAAGFDVLHTSIHSLLDRYLPVLSRQSLVSMDFSSDGFTHVNVAELAPFLHFAFFSAGGRPREDMDEMLHFAAAQGIREVICTMGLRGSCGLSNGVPWTVPAYPNAQAIDALGAGDAFIASFLVNYADNGGNAAEAAEVAAHFAAENCGHYGAFGHPISIPDSGLTLDES